VNIRTCNVWYNGGAIKYGDVPLGTGHALEDPTTRKLEASYRMNTISPCAKNGNTPHFTSLHIVTFHREEVSL
jgi:hypothetical protein